MDITLRMHTPAEKWIDDGNDLFRMHPLFSGENVSNGRFFCVDLFLQLEISVIVAVFESSLANTHSRENTGTA